MHSDRSPPRSGAAGSGDTLGDLPIAGDCCLGFHPEILGMPTNLGIAYSPVHPIKKFVSHELGVLEAT
jgi:hypothetical protein